MMVPVLGLVLTLVDEPARLLTLEDALETARKNHPNVAAARAAVASREKRVDETSAALLPRVSASARYGLSTLNRSGDRANSFELGSSFDAGISLRQLIYDFGATPGRVDVSAAAVEGERATEESIRLDLDLLVRTTYFDALAGKALVASARRSLENQERQLEQISSFVRLGARPEIDLVEAKSATADAKLSLVRALGSERTYLARLTVALGMEPTEFEVRDEPILPVEGEDAELEGLAVEALSRRPEVVSLRHAREGLLASAGSKHAEYFPSLSVSGNLSEGGTALDDLSWNVGASVDLSWNIFEGGATKAAEGALQADLLANAARAKSLEHQVRIEVEEAVLSVRTASAAVSAQAETMALARERLRLAEGRYAAGVGSSIELQDALTRVATTDADGVRAKNDLASARARLVRALGRSGPNR